ncbi:extracellular solute-binding protein [Actinomadura sp. ATCC 31491]|uniref:Extracellular solute-binding protein n=1 Tax=Actinomadura luzonensis TaxID=2805427 RepID=A0ABT0FUN1_9ACTN|nr:extracellular solute-binding protein [Actinomadura luzonensis]MCK2216041.1 extracellular solute-binding protein [Actinomadura luzonensis]
MRYRSAVAVLAGLATAAALTACGRSAESPGQAQPSSTVAAKATGRITMWAMGTEGELLPAFLKTFEAANPGVKVDVTAVPWDSSYQKFQTAIASGNVPDVAMMPGLPVFKDAFAPVPEAVRTADMYPGAVATGTMGGRLLEVPWYVDVRVLYYRTDLARKAGWDRPPATWDELRRLAGDLRKKAGAKWGIRLPAGMTGSFLSTLWMPWSNGGELMNAGRSAWTLDTPEFAAAYEYLASYFEQGLADANADPAPAAAVKDFLTGATPMLVAGPFVRGAITQSAGDAFTGKYATVPLPAGKSSTSFVGGANLVVFKAAKNPGSAWKLVQWLSEPSTQVAWYRASGDLPAVRSAWQDPALTADPTLAAFAEQLKTAKAPPQLVSFDKVGAAGDSAIERIVKGGTPVADALRQLQQQADGIGVS